MFTWSNNECIFANWKANLKCFLFFFSSEKAAFPSQLERNFRESKPKSHKVHIIFPFLPIFYQVIFKFFNQNNMLYSAFFFTILLLNFPHSVILVMEQSLEDEMLLTQLCLDERNIVIYDISPMINFSVIQPKAM